MALHTREAISAFRRRPGLRRFLTEHLLLDTGKLRWDALVDIAADCSLKCKMCPKVAVPGARPMTSETLENLAVKVLPHLADAAMGCRFEPFMHPDVPGAVARLRQHRDERGLECQLGILTSGVMMNGTSMEALAGLSRVQFSVDSTDPATYQELRGGVPVSRVLDTIERMVAGSGPGMPAVHAMVLLSRRSLETLETTMRDLAALGVGSVQINQMVPWKRSLAREALTSQGEDETVVRTLAAAVDLGRSLGMDVEPPARLPPPIGDEPFPLLCSTSLWDEVHAAKNRRAVCTRPWSSVRIDASGNVFPCLVMYEPKDAWGNINEASFDELVNSDKAIALRSALLEGRAATETCARCPIGPITRKK